MIYTNVTKTKKRIRLKKRGTIKKRRKLRKQRAGHFSSFDKGNQQTGELPEYPMDNNIVLKCKINSHAFKHLDTFDDFNINKLYEEQTPYFVNGDNVEMTPDLWKIYIDFVFAKLKKMKLTRDDFVRAVWIDKYNNYEITKNVSDSNNEDPHFITIWYNCVDKPKHFKKECQLPEPEWLINLTSIFRTFLEEPTDNSQRKVYSGMWINKNHRSASTL